MRYGKLRISGGQGYRRIQLWDRRPGSGKGLESDVCGGWEEESIKIDKCIDDREILTREFLKLVILDRFTYSYYGPSKIARIN